VVRHTWHSNEGGTLPVKEVTTHRVTVLAAGGQPRQGVDSAACKNAHVGGDAGEGQGHLCTGTGATRKCHGRSTCRQRATEKVCAPSGHISTGTLPPVTPPSNPPPR
jgi:hypothetical protein